MLVYMSISYIYQTLNMMWVYPANLWSLLYFSSVLYVPVYLLIPNMRNAKNRQRWLNLRRTQDAARGAHDAKEDNRGIYGSMQSSSCDQTVASAWTDPMKVYGIVDMDDASPGDQYIIGTRELESYIISIQMLNNDRYHVETSIADTNLLFQMSSMSILRSHIRKYQAEHRYMRTQASRHKHKRNGLMIAEYEEEDVAEPFCLEMSLLLLNCSWQAYFLKVGEAMDIGTAMRTRSSVLGPVTPPST